MCHIRNNLFAKQTIINIQYNKFDAIIISRPYSANLNNGQASSGKVVVCRPSVRRL